MDVIPECLIQYTLSYININKLLKYMTISKLFLKLINNIFTSLQKYENNNILKSKLFVILNKTPNLQILKISRIMSLTDLFFTSLNNTLSNLTELTINNSHYITDKSIKLAIDHSKNLQLINLDKCKHITNETLFFLAENFTKLESVSLKYCSKITNTGLITLTSQYDLVYLDIGYCIQITNIGIMQCNVKLLKYINIESCYKINDAGVHYILQSSADLSYLNIGHCDRLSDNFFFNINTLKLNTIILRNVTNFTFTTFPPVKDLQYLNLLGCHHINEECLNYCLINNPLLKELNLKYCSSITNKTIECIQKNNKKLEILDIGYCHRISMINFDKILTNLPNLKHISLYGCSYSNFYVCKYNKKINNRLIYLDLSYCSKLTSYYLCDLIKKCPNIKYLFLQNVYCVNQIVVNHILDILSDKLEKLNIINNSTISISEILNKCPKLIKI